jgi:hypothetical protein
MYEKVYLGLQVIALFAVGVTLGLVVWALIIVRRPLPTPVVVCNSSGGGGSVLVPSALCNDSNVCTVDLHDAALNTCLNLNAAAGTTCTSACWHADAPLTCDGRGRCGSSNASACRGRCAVNASWPDFGTWRMYEALADGRTAGCDLTTIPLKPHFLGAAVNQTDNVLPVRDMYNFGYPVCFAQVCNLVFLTVTGSLYEWPPARKRAASETWYPLINVHTAFPCEELLDTDAPGFDAACIVTREVSVDAHFLQAYVTAFVPTNSSDVPDDAFNQTYVGRFCSFHYACAATNASIYADPINTLPMRKRDVTAALRARPLPVGLMHTLTGAVLEERARRRRR